MHPSRGDPRRLRSPATSGRTLTHEVAPSLGVSIVPGTMTPEKPMPTEAQLGIRFCVSRAVIREAVKILSSKGLIATRRPLGTWVQPESDWNMLDPDVL